MFKHKSNIEIRFADIDAFGHVNNAVFLTYFEQARVNYFDEVLGWDYDWSKEGVIVARSEVDYILPVRFRDSITLYTGCSRIGNKSFDISYQAIRTDNQGNDILVADGVTVMVTFDYVKGKSIEVPAHWKEKMEIFER
jgi:acyl-CoA thioester hydrolase